MTAEEVIRTALLVVLVLNGVGGIIFGINWPWVKR